MSVSNESHRKAVAKYDAANTKFYGLKLNLKTDADIIGYLDSVPSVQGAIKEALRAYCGSSARPEQDKYKL